MRQLVSSDIVCIVIDLMTSVKKSVQIRPNSKQVRLG